MLWFLKDQRFPNTLVNELYPARALVVVAVMGHFFSEEHRPGRGRGGGFLRAPGGFDDFDLGMDGPGLGAGGRRGGHGHQAGFVGGMRDAMGAMMGGMLGGDDVEASGRRQNDEEEEEESLSYHKVGFPEHWARYLGEALPASLEAAQEVV